MCSHWHISRITLSKLNYNYLFIFLSFPEGGVAGEHRVFIAPVASHMRASGPHLSPFTLLNMIQWSFGEDHLDCWVEKSKTARLDAVTGVQVGQRWLIKEDSPGDGVKWEHSQVS